MNAAASREERSANCSQVNSSAPSITATLRDLIATARSREPRGAIGELFPGKLERAVDYRNFTGPDRNCSSKSLCEAKFIRHY
jgi:hypothetical protein